MDNANFSIRGASNSNKSLTSSTLNLCPTTDIQNGGQIPNQHPLKFKAGIERLAQEDNRPREQISALCSPRGESSNMTDPKKRTSNRNENQKQSPDSNQRTPDTGVYEYYPKLQVNARTKVFHTLSQESKCLNGGFHE